MPQMMRRFIPKELYDSYFKFSFVGNPWDKAVSEYHWYLRYGEPLIFNQWLKTLDKRLKQSTNLPMLEIVSMATRIDPLAANKTDPPENKVYRLFSFCFNR